jgi:predicted lipoprotein with Yx(FWY)xxD motif
MTSQTATTWRRGAGATAAVGILLVLSACGSSNSSSGGSGTSSASPKAAAGGTSAKGVNVAQTSAGNVLVDAKGMTMYAFARDSKGHSNCYGTCAAYWPPVPGSEKAHVASTVTAKVGTTKRKDGSTELTVNGWPMYTFVGDSAPGQASGQGKNTSGGLWWVVAPNGAWIKKTSSSSSSSGGSGGGGY